MTLSSNDALSEVTLCECFARDGLQHESADIPTAIKAEVIDAFAKLGFLRVEATSYSNPEVVPQFADASKLLAVLPRRTGVHYKATCANVRAVERAVRDVEHGIGANEISFLASASDSHSERNLRRTRDSQWVEISKMAAAAGGRFRLIASISVAFGCPFEGRVDPRKVLHDVERFARLRVTHVSLADTTGMATPQRVRELFRKVLQEYPEVTPIAHFHDSRGTGLVNYIAALEAGVRWFDCAIGGVGGHPQKVKYGSGHTGNVCTEDWISLLHSMGVRTGIDLQGLLETGRRCESILGRMLESRVLRAGANPLLDQEHLSA